MNDEELFRAIKERYRELRDQTGLKQIEFAEKHNLDRQQVNNWESPNSTRGMSIYTIHKFCKLTGYELKDFFDSPLFVEENGALEKKLD